MPLQIRRGTTTQRTAIVPLPGELIYDTTTGGIYVGNGTTSGGLAAVNLSPGDIRNVSATMFTTGVHTGISFEYEPSYNRINATVSPDLSNYQGVIRASAFQGTLVGDDSTIIIDGLTNKIQLDGTVKGNIVPDADSAYDIGSVGRKFKDLYLSGSSIYLGSATITSTGSVVNLPAGSKVGGVVIGAGGTGDGVIEGSNYKINIVGTNSSVIVDADNNTLRGNLRAFDSTTAYNASTKAFTGSLTGNVSGNVSGNVTGNITGNVISSNTSATILNTTGATALFTGSVSGNVTGNVKGNLSASDNSVAFNASTKSFAGTFDGDLTGNVSKTGFGILNISAGNGGIDIRATNTGGNPGDGDIRIANEGKSSLYVKGVTDNFVGSFEGAWIKLQASRTSIASPTALQPSDVFGGLEATGFNGTNYAYGGYAGFVIDPDGTITNGGGFLPTAFIVNVSNGTSVDLQNVMVYAADGTLSAPIVQPGVYATTTARDTFIIAPRPGMIVYIEATSKFTGYVNDAGGANPGWVNLN